jgi:hypothetical protein
MNHFTLQLLRLLLGLAAVSATAPASAVTSLTPSETRLIHLACHHDVVMLGENSHGDGATIALKAKLIPSSFVAAASLPLHSKVAFMTSLN